MTYSKVSGCPKACTAKEYYLLFAFIDSQSTTNLQMDLVHVLVHTGLDHYLLMDKADMLSTDAETVKMAVKLLTVQANWL